MERIIDRFSKYMELKRLNNNRVTVDCGLSVGLIGQAKRGKCDLGHKAIERILSTYIDINRVWLLTGEGPMLLEQSPPTITQNNVHSPHAVNSINVSRPHKEQKTFSVDDIASTNDMKPLVPVSVAKQPNLDVYEVVKNHRIENASYFNTFSAFAAFDMYYEVTQDAMLPNYLPGDILALQAMQPGDKFQNGSPVVADTKPVGLIFRLGYDRGDAYELRVTNRSSQYEDESWPKSSIFRIYRVVGMVRTGM